MKSPDVTGGMFEKANTGWFGGCNSARNPWWLPDNQYQWAVNMVNRGGVMMVRPGRRLVATLPEGNLQGMTKFRVTKSEDNGVDPGNYLVAAVDGRIYAVPVSLLPTNIENWEQYRVKNLSFKKSAEIIYWAETEQSTSSSDANNLQIVPTFSKLMIQDGQSQAGSWDGVESTHLDEKKQETPIGTWMKWSGNRLWVSRDKTVIAGDQNNPVLFKERNESATDWKMNGVITGLARGIGENRKSNLIVFTDSNATTLLSSILDREAWLSTADFQTELLPDTGCVAGRSIVNHGGLLWWYAPGGLVNIDSAAAAFLSSKIKFRDVEMTRSKRKLAENLSKICAFSYDSYLGVSVPSNDSLNAHTWILDNSPADELNSQSEPAWNGVWTGIRPVEWARVEENGRSRLFCASSDYQALPGETSKNHIWEEFQPDRTDSYFIYDQAGTATRVRNKIYWQFEPKMFGDSMDYKKIHHVEADLVELGGEVNIKISYAGFMGKFHTIMNKKIVATLYPEDAENGDKERAQKLYDVLSEFRVQSRRVKTENIDEDEEVSGVKNIEQFYKDSISKSYSIMFQGCGRVGIDSFRIFMTPWPEETNIDNNFGDENGTKILSNDGESLLNTEVTDA